VASGYDLSSSVPFRLMQGRLGVYEKKPFDLEQSPTKGVESQYTRLNQ
jgi:hypothetical protein